MTLAEKIGKRSKVRSPALVDFNTIDSACAKVLNRWPDIVATVPERNREAVVAAVANRVRQDDWTDCTLTAVTRAARVVFDAAFRARPDLADVRRFFVRETRGSTRPGFLSAMVIVYLESYEPKAEHTKALADALTAARGHLGPRWGRLITKLPSIFDPDRAPDKLAELMDGMVDPYAELKAIGLRNPHGIGLMDHAHFCFLRLIERTLNTEAGIARLFGWLKPDGIQARVSGATTAIEAVLRPWGGGPPWAHGPIS